MIIDQMKDVKVGDIIVKVRKHYQNYDYTKVPCEPKVYTISYKGCGEIAFNKTVKRSFLKDGMRYVSAHGCDNSFIYSEFETLEVYLGGEYNKAIVLYKTKWDSEKEFLLFKIENNHKIAREIEQKRVEKEDRELYIGLYTVDRSE
jgi:hypothetical protein